MGNHSRGFAEVEYVEDLQIKIYLYKILNALYPLLQNKNDLLSYKSGTDFYKHKYSLMFVLY